MNFLPRAKTNPIMGNLVPYTYYITFYKKLQMKRRKDILLKKKTRYSYKHHRMKFRFCKKVGIPSFSIIFYFKTSLYATYKR